MRTDISRNLSIRPEWPIRGAIAPYVKCPYQHGSRQLSERPATPGYRLSGTVFQRDLYRLLCAIMALEPICRLETDNSDDPIVTLKNQFAEDEIVHLLISTAIMNRRHMDHMGRLRKDPAELSFQPVDCPCGELHPDADSEVKQPLSLRGAANKIIHADEVRLISGHQPALHLIGRLEGRQWLAIVDIVDYVRASAINFEDALV